jgi:hypothetical protein
VGRSLMETLCRVMAAQHRHATAAGVRVSLAVPDSRRMTIEASAPLSWALCRRCCARRSRPGGMVEMRVGG